MNFSLSKKSKNGDVVLTVRDGATDHNGKSVTVTQAQLDGLVELLKLAQKADAITLGIDL